MKKFYNTVSLGFLNSYLNGTLVFTVMLVSITLLQIQVLSTLDFSDILCSSYNSMGLILIGNNPLNYSCPPAGRSVNSLGVRNSSGIASRLVFFHLPENLIDEL